MSGYPERRTRCSTCCRMTAEEIDQLAAAIVRRMAAHERVREDDKHFVSLPFEEQKRIQKDKMRQQDRERKGLKRPAELNETSEEASTDTAPLIPETGFLRLPEILKMVPVSASSWWRGVREGRYPAAIKLGVRTTVWRAEDIRALIKEQGK